MRKNGRYRFTLQFPAGSKEQIEVGELLESMGNRKSTLVVQAVFLYMENHLKFAGTRDYSMPIFSAETRENEIGQVTHGRLLEPQTMPSDIALSPAVSSSANQGRNLEFALDSMLDNLSLFQ